MRSLFPVFPQHDGETLWPFGAHDVIDPADIELQYLAIEEHERIECLVLCGCADVLFNRECS